MIVINNVYSADGFEFWSGARDTIEELTPAQIDTVWSVLESDIFPEGATDTEINDFFWFERDFIADLLGFEDFDDLMKNNGGEV